jgi:hypothetical protein
MKRLACLLAILCFGGWALGARAAQGASSTAAVQRLLDEALGNSAIRGTLVGLVTSGVGARESYGDGIKAARASDHATAIRKFDLAVSQLGRSNIRIQPQLIRSLMAVKNYPRAAAEYQKYMELTPSKELVEFGEMEGLKRQAERAIAQDTIDYQAAVGQKEDSAYALYLQTYPFGLHTAAVLASRDDAAYFRAKRTGAFESYLQYLDSYPWGAHAQEARSLSAAMETSAYEAAVKGTSTQACEYYLRSLARGSRVREVAARLVSIRDDSAFAAAHSSNTKTSFEKYLADFPGGTHVSEARAEVRRIEEAEKEAQRVLAAKRRKARQRELTEEVAGARKEASGHYAIGALKLVGGLGGAGGGLIMAVVGYGKGSTMDWDTGETLTEPNYPLMAVGAAGIGLGVFLLTSFMDDFESGDYDTRRAAEAQSNLSRLSFSLAPTFTRSRNGGINGIEAAIRFPLPVR